MDEALLPTLLLAPIGAPFPEALYPDTAAVKAALQKHTGENGYTVSVELSNTRRVFYICSKGKDYRSRKDPDIYTSRQYKNTSTAKTGYLFTVVARKVDSSWQTTTLKADYNHSPAAAKSAYIQYRIASITLEQQSKVKEINSQCYSPNQILNSLRHDDPSIALIPKDIYNLLAGFRAEELYRKTPIE
jgi:hypothetical protein